MTADTPALHPTEILPAATPEAGMLAVLGGIPVTAEQWATAQADQVAAEAYLTSIVPANTARAYESDWRMWQAFRMHRAELGEPVHELGGTPGTLVAFVRWLDEFCELAPSSVDRRLSGVIENLRSRGVEPGKAAARMTRAAINELKRDREKLARGRGRADAFTAEHLGALLDRCDPETIVGLRNRALYLLSFCYASRVSEASKLMIRDVVVRPGYLEVHVPAVKLRGGMSARTVIVPASSTPGSPTCPHAAWTQWRAALGQNSGPAWRPISVKGRPLERGLSIRGLEWMLAQDVGKARLTVDEAGNPNGLRLSWHAFRAGSITQLLEKRVLPSKVYEISGHAPGSPTFNKYVRHSSQVSDNAISALSL